MMLELGQPNELAPAPAPSISFDSRSEAACAVLLERYVPGWRAREGVTVHVKLGKWTVDFLVNDAVLEYHPTTRHDAVSQQAYERILEAVRPIKGDKKREILSALHEELGAQYWKRRRQILDAHGFGDVRLIVAGSPSEVWRRVLWAQGYEGIPSEQSFCREFRRLVRNGK